MKPISIVLVAFATPDYEPELDAMAESLGSVSEAVMEHSSASLPCVATYKMREEVYVHFCPKYLPAMKWADATSAKPGIILDAMQDGTIMADWFMYLDADARFVRQPPFRAMHDQEAEGMRMPSVVSAHVFSHPRKGPELLSGTLLFRAGEEARQIVAGWSQRCLDDPGKWDQKHLTDELDSRGMLMQGANINKLLILGPEWCWIDGGREPDLSEQAYGHRVPFIIQTQASRRLKHKEHQA